MAGNQERARSRARKWTRGFCAVGALALAGTLAGGCLSRDIETIEPRSTTTIVEVLTQSSVDKIDILLAIDNSISMADKQDVLAAAVPDLIEGLVNPGCVDSESGAAVSQPANITDPCPEGSEREFEPVVDIHIGIISSSLGDYGTDGCPLEGANGDPTKNDMGHLIERSLDGSTVPTYQCDGAGCGFLAWAPSDPETGESKKTAIGLPAGIEDTDALVAPITDLVQGVGQSGCGYEAQLESWYRFLVDPEPYASISIPDVNSHEIVKEGIDEVVLKQRADFLRPNSLLAVVMLTDENDCSVRAESFYSLVLRQKLGSNEFRMYKGTSACATNPNDPCCTSCAGGTPDGCSEDPCQATQETYAEEQDDINLRCWNQKQRFGIDFLYPTRRYINALTQAQINPAVPDLSLGDGDAVTNPIFTDLDPNDAITGVRSPDLVFFAGIVGVPWQNIARTDEGGNPNLVSGLDSDGNAIGGFQTFDELTQNGIWDQILGTPKPGEGAAPVPPTDALMIESLAARSGTTASGEALAPPTNKGGNSINGNEWDIVNNDDLQYACIFDLPEARDCTVEGACDCDDVAEAATNPLCAANPNDGGNPTLQTKAKAYPGTRHLEVLKGVGAQGVVASVCPAQLDVDENADGTKARDFGYRPAIGAIIERLKSKLGGQCLPRSLTPDPTDGSVSCIVLEALKTNGSCGCSGGGRSPVSEENQTAKEAVENDPIYTDLGYDCVCQIDQLLGDDGDACRDNVTPPAGLDGWCYIDATTTPPTGNADLVAGCPDTEKRLINFINAGEPTPGATLFITCTGE